MIEEPYRWLDAISNRREYIRAQLKAGTPVFAVSRPEGILLLGVGQGQSKVFEIYDRHGLAALGHPVDIEKLRQTAIEAAHLEGFNRSAQDVTLRRLISFSLSSSLKNAFEQIFASPIIVESIFAEVGTSAAQDTLVRLHYDGDHQYLTSKVVVAHRETSAEAEAAEWISRNLKDGDSLTSVANTCLAAWQVLNDSKTFQGLPAPSGDVIRLPGKVVEAAFLARHASGPVHYRVLDLP